jgi:hypothetical protein
MTDLWIKSSRCVGDEHCVEISASSSVKVRDRYGKVIEVDRRSWQLFIDEISHVWENVGASDG